MFKSLVAQWTATVGVGIASSLLTIFIARNIGPDSFGIYATALAAGSLFAIFIDGGFRLLILREHSLPSKKPMPLSNSLLALAMGHAIIISGLLFVVALIIFSGDRLFLALTTIAVFFVLSINQTTSSVLRGAGSLYLDSIFQLGARLSTILGVLFLLLLGYKQPWQILAVWAIAGGAFLFPYKRLLKSPRIMGLFEIYPIIMPFFLMELAITIYIRSDIVLLNFFGINSSQIGQYAAAFRICEAFVMVSGPIGLMIFRYYRLVGRSLHAWRWHIAWSIFLALLCSGFLAVIVWLYSEEVIVLIYGEKYSQAGGYLKVLAPMILFVIPNLILNQAVIAAEKEHVCMTVAMLVAIVNVILLTIALPLFGIMAAAWIKVVTEGLVCMLMSAAVFLSVQRSGQPVA